MSESINHFVQLLLGLLGFAIIWAVFVFLLPFLFAIILGQILVGKVKKVFAPRKN